MSTPDYCTDPQHKIQSATAGGVLVCFDCGKPMPPPPTRDKMPADVQREIARLRRIVNESLDRIQELMRAA